MIRKIFNQNRKIGAVQTAFGIFIGTGVWLTGMAAESTLSTTTEVNSEESYKLVTRTIKGIQITELGVSYTMGETGCSTYEEDSFFPDAYLAIKFLEEKLEKAKSKIIDNLKIAAIGER